MLVPLLPTSKYWSSGLGLRPLSLLSQYSLQIILCIPRTLNTWYLNYHLRAVASLIYFCSPDDSLNLQRPLYSTSHFKVIFVYLLFLIKAVERFQHVLQDSARSGLSLICHSPPLLTIIQSHQVSFNLLNTQSSLTPQDFFLYFPLPRMFFF